VGRFNGGYQSADALGMVAVVVGVLDHLALVGTQRMAGDDLTRAQIADM
jgi:hypothetical protein